MTIPFYGVVLHEIDKIIANPENQVYLLSCDGTLKNCVVNPTTDRAICKVCSFAKNVGEKPYRDKVKMLSIGDLVNASKIIFPKYKYENIKDIQNITYKDCLIGYGALSSYVSYTRNQEPIMDDEFRNYFDDLLNSQILIINALEELQVKVTFSEVYLYNGRWADVRPVFDLFKRDNIQVNVMESINNGTTSFDNEIFINVLPQNIDHRNIIINKTWVESKIGEKQKEKEASEFYINRKNADFTRTDIKIFTANQQVDVLPENWDNSKLNISIFNSSEDEFVALGSEWEQYQIFENQEAGIKAILSSFENDSSIHFYLRIHPNLANIKYGYHTRLYNLEKTFSNVTVISGDSEVSTYKLIDQSEKIIVFGSSVGVEACYWRKPVILLGGTSYYFQNVAYIPKSFEETVKMIKMNLEPKPIIGALKFGYFLLNHKLYTETITSEPYPLKIVGKTFGYGFKHMKIWGSPILFKVVYKLYLMFITRFYSRLLVGSTVIPTKGK